MPQRRWWSALPAVVSVIAGAHELPELQHTVSVKASDSIFCLEVPFIQQLTLVLDSLYVLQTPLDYELDARHGCVRLTPFFRRLFRYRDTVVLWVSARYVPLFIVPRGAEQSAMPVAVKHPLQEEAIAADSGAALRAEGKLVRGFTVQTGSGLVLYSGIEAGFQTRLAGQTELGGRIVAEQMPVTADGATMPLAGSDQVALYVRSATFHAEVGQLSVPSSVRDGTGVERLTGVGATAHVGGWGLSLLLGHAAARVVTARIQPIDGVPGPYRIRQGEGAAPLVPGSERVWVDGVLQERGEDKDYVIDYWRGELTFRPRRPLSAASQIVVECALMEEGRLRSLLSLGLQGTPTTAQHWSASYVHCFVTPMYEVAWQGKPLVHEGSGYAVLDGATWVGVDSLSGRGRGWYRRRDTIDGTRPVTVWQYAPGAPDAAYMVEFSFVGRGQGAYEPAGIGIFRYVGQGKGSYAPLRLLPLPSQRQRWELGWEWKPEGHWRTRLFGEFDRLQPYRRRAEWLSTGGFGVQARYTMQPDTASSPLLWEGIARWRAAAWADRSTADMEHRAVAWNVLPAVEQSATARLVFEQRLRVQSQPFRGEVSLGWQRYGRLPTAMRWGAWVEAAPAESARARMSYSGGRVAAQGSTPGYWHRLDLKGETGSGPWQWRATVRLDWQEIGEVQRAAEGSFVGLWSPVPPVQVEFQLPWRWQSVPWPSSWWQPALWLRWSRAEWNTSLRAGWNVLRQGQSSARFPLLLWQGNWRADSHATLQWLYEAGGGLSGTLAPVFLRVMPGQGSYRYRGDLNGNGISEAAEFEPVPAGGDHIMVPMRAEDVVGSTIRGEAFWSWIFPVSAWRWAEWQGRMSLTQRGQLRSPWWRTALPRWPADTAAVATQWMAEQQLRLRGRPWEVTLRGDCSGLLFWLGAGWERRTRASGEARFQAPFHSLLRFMVSAGPVWEEVYTVSWPGQHSSVLAAQAGVEVVWQLGEIAITPQLRLLQGWIGEQRVTELTNLSGGLSLDGRLMERWRVVMAVRSGLLRPAAVQGVWFLSSLHAGTTLSASLQYEAGSTVWSVQVQAVRTPSYPWWYTLSGQVHVRL